MFNIPVSAGYMHVYMSMYFILTALDPKPSTTHVATTDVCSQAMHTIISTMIPTVSCDPGYSLQCVSSNSLSKAAAVAITAVVGGLCSFTTGLLFGVLLTQCSVHCHRKQKRGQTERSPVYEDIQPEMNADIELQHNEAYGHVSH